MTGVATPADEHGTPLTEEEQRALIPTDIATRDDLNRAEQRAIAAASRRVIRRSPDATTLLTTEGVLALHKDMFAPVWRWAGRFRTTERNIGIEHWLIRQELARLLDDARTWLEFDSYPTAEICVRVHHRLVFIHCFANGNGRHARLFADLLARTVGLGPFSWGAADLVSASDARRRYIKALREADAGDVAALVAFASS